MDKGQKAQYNKLATHITQSWEWGEFRKKLGTKLLRFGLFKNGKLASVFQITFHKIPFVNSYVGYLPKGPYPDRDLAEALTKIGTEHNCAFIKIEPDIQECKVQPFGFAQGESAKCKVDKHFITSPKPLFTKFNYILDLTKSEEELLKNMHPKFRYNIKVARKHGVKVEDRTDTEAFEIYLKLHFETTKRQKFYSHSPYYHRQAWETLKPAGMARILIAYYTQPTTHNKQPINAWMLFNFKDTLYYPYGGSSVEHKNVMAPNLTLWEAVLLGKKLGLKKFDLWGALGPEASPSDPWQGFNQFKAKTGANLVEYLGTYDLILNPILYHPFTLIDRMSSLKFFLLKFL